MSEPEGVAVPALAPSDSIEDLKLCFLCGTVADGQLDPVCSKCGMVICRQHRNKNGIFTHHYTCFPCCWPVEMRVPWIEQQRRAKEAERKLRREQQQRRDAVANGIGDEMLPVRVIPPTPGEGDEADEEGATMPVRANPQRQQQQQQQQQQQRQDMLLATPVRPRLTAETATNATMAAAAKVRGWQEGVKTPSSSCSPGAMRDAAGTNSVVELWAKRQQAANAALQFRPMGVLNEPIAPSAAAAPAPSDPAEAPARPEDEHDDDDDLPVRARPVAVAARRLDLDATADHARPPDQYVDIGNDDDDEDDDDGGGEAVDGSTLPVRRAPAGVGATTTTSPPPPPPSGTTNTTVQRREFTFTRAGTT